MLLFDLHPPLDGNEIAGLVRSVAFSLAQLHAVGRAHGSVDMRHVAVEGGGGVRLLEASGDAAGTAADDVRALGHLITDLLAAGAPLPDGNAPAPRAAVGRRREPGLGAAALRLLRAPSRRARPGLLVPPSPAQALADIARLASVEDPTPPPSAASIAALVALRVPGARPPGSRPPSHDPTASQAAAAASPPLLAPPAGGLNMLVGRGAIVVTIVALALAVTWSVRAVAHRGRHTVQAAPTRIAAEPPESSSSGAAATRVWPSVAFRDGVLTAPSGRFSVGRTNDFVIAGDWFCRGRPVPALLRPASGEVFVFERWPDAGEEIPGHVVGHAPGAAGLRAVTDPAHGPPRCPALVAVQADGTTVPIPLPTTEPVQ